MNTVSNGYAIVAADSDETKAEGQPVKKTFKLEALRDFHGLTRT